MSDTKKKNIDYENLSRFKNNLLTVITQTEYEALSDEEKNIDTVYLVVDGNAAITDSDKDYIDAQDDKTLNVSKEYTDNEIFEIIDNAPEDLNTLGKLANFKLNPSDLITITNNEIDELVIKLRGEIIENKIVRATLDAINSDEIDTLRKNLRGENN